MENSILGLQTTRVNPRKPITQLPTIICSPQINLSNLLNMSQPSLKEKFEDEQLLSAALAIELEDVKKTLAQLKLDKTKPTHSGPFSLKPDYYINYSIRRICEELDKIESRLEKLESGEQPRDWNLYKNVWKLENFSAVSNNAKQFEEIENKNFADPNLARDFCSTAFFSKPYDYSFLSAPSLMDVAQHLANQCLSISLIAGPFDDILSWPFKGTIQISVFRQDNSGLIWTNLLKTNYKTTPCFSRSSPHQPNPSCCIFFYLPHEEMFKADKNLIKNGNVYIQIKILDFPWTPNSIPTIVNPRWDVVFEIQQRKRKRNKLWEN